MIAHLSVIACSARMILNACCTCMTACAKLNARHWHEHFVQVNFYEVVTVQYCDTFVNRIICEFLEVLLWDKQNCMLDHSGKKYFMSVNILSLTYHCTQTLLNREIIQGEACQHQK